MSKLVRNEGEVNHYCPTFMDVLHKLLEEFNIIFREKQWIGLGETALLFNNDLVHNYADLYKLTVEQILPLERMENLPITW
jgi:DNA ligase (NAD+)